MNGVVQSLAGYRLLSHVPKYPSIVGPSLSLSLHVKTARIGQRNQLHDSTRFGTGSSAARSGAASAIHSTLDICIVIDHFPSVDCRF